jgi:SAM-dependent methyltransferase
MSGQAGNWGGGYVTDIDYLPGWYPQQSPMHLAVTCLLLGIACDLPAGDEEVHYMELGCGLGLGAMVLAASNPSWRITAVDFNPAHIAQARAIARDAGLRNIAFVEADLATLAEQEEGRRLPQADFVSMHGVWSWVAQPVRDGIIRLLRDKVRSGGVVHVSYNALPGWQGALGMQRVLLGAGDAAGGSSERRAAAGVEVLRELMAAEAVHVASPFIARRMMERMPTLPAAYLTHEFMNRHWSPCFHADVMDMFAGAKLDWVGSASLTENYANLMLTEPQRAIYAKAEEPQLRELIKDLCLPRPLRHDVFVRGVQRIAADTRDAALRDLVLALTTPVDDLVFEVEVASGTASLSPEYYGPILSSLAGGPRSVRELMSLPGIDTKSNDPRELVGVLVGIGHALPMLRDGLGSDSVAQRFNRIVARWLARPEHFMKSFALASVAAGGGVPATAFDLFVNDRLQAGEDLGHLEQWLAMLRAGVADDERKALVDILTRAVTTRAPLMRLAGVG